MSISQVYFLGGGQEISVAKLLKIIDLENGLKLKLYDCSRKAAGDRWLVSLDACIDIPVDVAMDSAAEPALRSEQVKAALGESVRFRQSLQRNFIAETERQEVLQDLMVSFLSSTVKYLSRAEFPGKHLLKVYRKYRELSAGIRK
jgi:hypothetical protein